MGIFDAIKKAFDSGGLKVQMKAPRTFKFKDGSIPVTVTLRGNKKEARTVNKMRFTFKAEPKEGTQTSARNNNEGFTLEADRAESFELQPLQEVAIDFVMPLATGSEGGKVGSVVGKMLDAKNMFSSEEQWYVLTVEIFVEGAKARKSVTERIKNDGFSIGFSMGFGK